MSSATRQHHRRQKREAVRKCLTVSDVHLLNQQRRLPADHPSLGQRKHKNKPQRPRLCFPILSSDQQAWRFIRVINRSDAARKLCRWLDTHPGPQARCSGVTLLLGMCRAAEATGRYLRSDICSVINGLDATILHYLGLCNNKTFEPVSYSSVERQMVRLERAPFHKLMPPHLLHLLPEDEDTDSDSDDEEDKQSHRADLGLLWFNTDMLLNAIPKLVRELTAAAALDATAFPTFARVRDYRPQKEVDRAIRQALANGLPIPDGIIVGPHGKLQRCPHDPQASSTHRGASLATGHEARCYAGYSVVSVAASRDYRDYGDPEAVHLREDPGPYILSFSCATAGLDRGPIARDVIHVLKSALPGLAHITADREFSARRESLVRPLHEQGIGFNMDYQRHYTAEVRMVRVGRRKELVYVIAGDFYPLWLPPEFRGACPHRDRKARRDWHRDRARYRFVPNGPPNASGTIQFKCPQCAGHIVGAHYTRTGKHKGRQPPGVPSVSTGQLRQWCCNGTITIRAESLDWWQPLPWGTRPWAQVYKAGRARIENTNGIARKDGGLDPKSCRASGSRAHNMAFLALALVDNVQLADADPRANPEADDAPPAQLSLYCVLPAFGTSSGNGSGTAAAHQTSPNGGQAASLPQRAPP